jgi:hypothetical protein
MELKKFRTYLEAKLQVQKNPERAAELEEVITTIKAILDKDIIECSGCGKIIKAEDLEPCDKENCFGYFCKPCLTQHNFLHGDC